MIAISKDAFISALYFGAVSWPFGVPCTTSVYVIVYRGAKEAGWHAMGQVITSREGLPDIVSNFQRESEQEEALCAAAEGIIHGSVTLLLVQGAKDPFVEAVRVQGSPETMAAMLADRDWFFAATIAAAAVQGPSGPAN